MKYFVVCNDAPLGITPTVKGPGLRAHQLHTQITAAGHDAEYVMFSERYCRSSSFEDLMCSHASLRLVPEGQFKNLVDNIEPATFVFSQANFPNQIKLAAERHRIVFDFMARKDLELANSGKEDKVEQYLKDEKLYVDTAHTILVTSPKLEQHVQQQYNKDARQNPFSFKSMSFPKFAEPTIVFGGRLQKWTNYSNTFEAIADFLSAHRNCRGIFIYTGEIDNISDIHAKAVGRLLVLPNVTVLGFLPAAGAAEVAGKADLFVDCSTQNTERSFATSIRTIHAISCGTPVIHNAKTGLDDVFDPFPGVLTPEVEPKMLSDTLENSRLGGFADKVSHAQNAMDVLLTRNELSW